MYFLGKNFPRLAQTCRTWAWQTTLGKKVAVWVFKDEQVATTDPKEGAKTTPEGKKPAETGTNGKAPSTADLVVELQERMAKAEERLKFQEESLSKLTIPTTFPEIV